MGEVTVQQGKEHQEVLNEAYRRIGRNLFVFQEIELTLKTLLHDGHLQITASQLQRLIAERGAKPDKRTLGQLIDPLIDHHLTPFDPDTIPQKPSNEISISLRVTFKFTLKERESMMKELDDLVTERNELVHTLLLRHRFDTEEGCISACKDLER
ncbi:hypothetical protein [Lacunisphaera limnophila]|uniref:hypothetical protein n=1 Tax=Lacunisphaera limnophila TaxID=1838286 RepID=UPI0008597745|nr:hypothetical protein [Lacunisphaera limnophila]